MKKFFMIFLSILIIFAFGGCDKSEQFDIKQEIVLVIEHEFYSGAEGMSFITHFIDNEGKSFSLPEELADFDELILDSEWYEKAVNFKKTSDPLSTIKAKHFNVMCNFVGNFDSYVNCQLKDYDYTVNDYGVESLYLIYESPNGTVKSKLLCTYGQSTECIDDDAVRDFVNWMIKNNFFYIPDKDFKY